MAKVFFPLENWNSIDSLLRDDVGLEHTIKDLELTSKDLQELRLELNSIFQKTSSSLQKDQDWSSVRDTISYQHKVLFSITPNGKGKPIECEVLMGLEEIGLESKLIGKSVQSQPSKLSFNVKALKPSHPLSAFSLKNFSGVLAIQNVFSPPVKLPMLQESESASAFCQDLLFLLRSFNYNLANDSIPALRKLTPESKALKTALRCICDYLDHFSNFPDKFKHLVTEQIQSIGIKFDPEMELAYLQSMHQVYLEKKHYYLPEAFQKQIDVLFKNRYKFVLNQIIEQMHAQQAIIQERLKSYSTTEADKKRMFHLQEEVNQQRKKGASEETLRTKKAEIKKILKKVQTAVHQYESSKGIILMHEILLSTLHGDEELVNLLPKNKVGELKSRLQANHISSSKDIERLTRTLGMHADHLLVQHAIYSEVEPDISQVVILEDIGTYDKKQLSSILTILPSLGENLKMAISMLRLYCRPFGMANCPIAKNRNSFNFNKATPTLKTMSPIVFQNNSNSSSS